MIRFVRAVFTIAMLGPVGVNAAEWKASRAVNGAPVARFETGDPLVPVIELACDGGRLALAVQARAPANVRGLPVIFAGSDGRSVSATLPRLGSFPSFTGILPNFVLADGLAGQWRTWAVMVGNRRLTPTLAGAPDAIRTGLSACHRQANGAALAVVEPAVSGSGDRTGSQSSLFSDTTLPQVVRDDLADFADSCNYDYNEFFRFEARSQPWSGNCQGERLAARRFQR